MEYVMFYLKMLSVIFEAAGIIEIVNGEYNLYTYRL